MTHVPFTIYGIESANTNTHTHTFIDFPKEKRTEIECQPTINNNNTMGKAPQLH